MNIHEHVRPERPVDWPFELTVAQLEFDELAKKAKRPGSGLKEIAPGVWRGTARETCPFCAEDEPHGWVSGPC